MSLIFKDRVKETTSTTGTGDIVLAGAADGYQAFSAIGDGNTTYYCIVSGNDWEVGVGTYTLATTTLSRDTILDSSTGSAISLSGTSTVFCTYAASKSVALELSNKISQAYTDYDPTIIISPGSSTRNQITPTGDYIPLALSLTSGHTTNALVVKNSSDVVVMSIGPTGTIKTFDSGGTKGVSISHDGTNGVVSTSSGKLKHVLPSARYLDIDDHWFGTGVHINAVDPASVGNTALYLGNDYNGSHLSVKCTASNVLVGTENNTSLYSLEGGWCGASTTCLRWTASTSGASTPDTGLSRNAAGVIQVNSGTAGALRDLTCRSLLPVAQTATDVPLTITLAAAQSANAITVNNSSATTVFSISSAGAITTASSITASGTIIGGNLRAGGGGYIYWANRCLISSPIDSQILMTSSSTTDFGRLQFGGTTSSYPSIKRNGAGIDIRLADDSNYANLAAANLTSNGNPVGTGRDIYNLVW